MNTLSKIYKKKHKKQKIQKAFNIIMIAIFMFMLVFSVQMCRKANELQKQLTEQVK